MNVIRIAIENPRVASMDRRWKPCVAPSLTVKRVISGRDRDGMRLTKHGLGLWAVDRSRLYLPVGLLPDIQRSMIERGYRVEIYPLRDISLPEPRQRAGYHATLSPPHRELVSRLLACTSGILLERRLDAIAKILALLHFATPEAYMVVCTPNSEERNHLAERLHALRVRINLEGGKRGQVYRSLYLTNLSSALAPLSACLATFFIATSVESLLERNLNRLRQILHNCRWETRVFGFMAERAYLDRDDHLFACELFGSGIYRCGSQRDVHFTFLDGAGTPSSLPLSGNCVRNLRIASLALAFRSGDRNAYERLLPTALAHWSKTSAQRPPSVLLVVEDREHARKLQQLLPKWRTLKSASEPLQHGGEALIATQEVLATQTKLPDYDICLYAAPGSAPKLPRALIHSRDGGPLLLVDYADLEPEEAMTATRRRLRWYREQGWTPLPLPIELTRDGEERLWPVLPGRSPNLGNGPIVPQLPTYQMINLGHLVGGVTTSS
jgi:hypothetical protein